MKRETRNLNDSKNTDLQPAMRSDQERGEEKKKTIPLQGSIKYTSNLAEKVKPV